MGFVKRYMEWERWKEKPNFPPPSMCCAVRTRDSTPFSLLQVMGQPGHGLCQDELGQRGRERLPGRETHSNLGQVSKGGG